MPEEIPEFLISKEYMRRFVDQVAELKQSGLESPVIAEGERLATSFRTLFPEVSDKDLGTIIMVFCQVFVEISECHAHTLSYTLDSIGGSYAYCAAEIISGVLAIDDMTS